MFRRSFLNNCLSGVIRCPRSNRHIAPNRSSGWDTIEQQERAEKGRTELRRSGRCHGQKLWRTKVTTERLCEGQKLLRQTEAEKDRIYYILEKLLLKDDVTGECCHE